jgi:hypothetical protein
MNNFNDIELRVSFLEIIVNNRGLNMVLIDMVRPESENTHDRGLLSTKYVGSSAF